jgi:hypothetical protein
MCKVPCWQKDFEHWENCRASLQCELSCDAVETGGWRMSCSTVHRHEVSLLLRLFFSCNWMLMKLLCIRVSSLVQGPKLPSFRMIKNLKNIAIFSLWCLPPLSPKEASTPPGEQKGLQILNFYIFIQCSGSMTFRCRSGSGSTDPCLWLKWIRIRLFLSLTFKIRTKNYFKNFFCLSLFEGNYIIF